MIGCDIEWELIDYDIRTQRPRPGQPIEENCSTTGNANHGDVRDLLSVAERGSGVGRPSRRDSARERDKIKRIETTEGTVGEGSRVRLIAFLSEGAPHANTGESVNCNLKTEANNDIHISVTETKDASEFEGIVVEMIPQDRSANWTSDNIETLRGKVLLIEGGLFYDNLHFVNGDANNPVPGGQPKHFSLCQIHPITSVKVCKNATVDQCDPDRATIGQFSSSTGTFSINRSRRRNRRSLEPRPPCRGSFGLKSASKASSSRHLLPHSPKVAAQTREHEPRPDHLISHEVLCGISMAV
jgi:hypothetical protein